MKHILQIFSFVAIFGFVGNCFAKQAKVRSLVDFGVIKLNSDKEKGNDPETEGGRSEGK